MIAARIAIPLLGGAMLAAMGIVSLCRGEEPEGVALLFLVCRGEACRFEVAVSRLQPMECLLAGMELMPGFPVADGEFVKGYTCVAGERA